MENSLQLRYTESITFTKSFMKKKLYRSHKNKVFLGVLGGLAEYYNQDPTTFRILFIIALLISGIFPFGIAYFIAYALMPIDPSAPIEGKTL